MIKHCVRPTLWVTAVMTMCKVGVLRGMQFTQTPGAPVNGIPIQIPSLQLVHPIPSSFVAGKLASWLRLYGSNTGGNSRPTYPGGEGCLLVESLQRALRRVDSAGLEGCTAHCSQLSFPPAGQIHIIKEHRAHVTSMRMWCM